VIAAATPVGAELALARHQHGARSSRLPMMRAAAARHRDCRALFTSWSSMRARFLLDDQHLLEPGGEPFFAPSGSSGQVRPTL